eukprot:tig00001033_g6499.t1
MAFIVSTPVASGRTAPVSTQAAAKQAARQISRFFESQAFGRVNVGATRRAARLAASKAVEFVSASAAHQSAQEDAIDVSCPS